MIANRCSHIPLRCFSGVTPRTSAPPRSHSGAGVLIAARLGVHRTDRTLSHHIECAGQDQADSARRLDSRLMHSPLRTLVEHAKTTAQRVMTALRDQAQA